VDAPAAASAPDAPTHDAPEGREHAPRPNGDVAPHAAPTAEAPTLAAAPAVRDVAPAPRAHEPAPPEAPAPRAPEAVHEVERLVRLDELRPRPLHEGGDMRLELSPEGLGRIEVRVSVRDDGVQANVLAQHDHAREMIELHRPALEAALGRSSLRLDAFTVGLGDHRQGDAGVPAQEQPRPATEPKPRSPEPSSATPLPGASHEGGISLRA
jgi:flagellar hook-length control protein FliK